MPVLKTFYSSKQLIFSRSLFSWNCENKTKQLQKQPTHYPVLFYMPDLSLVLIHKLQLLLLSITYECYNSPCCCFARQFLHFSKFFPSPFNTLPSSPAALAENREKLINRQIIKKAKEANSSKKNCNFCGDCVVVSSFQFEGKYYMPK